MHTPGRPTPRALALLAHTLMYSVTAVDNVTMPLVITRVPGEQLVLTTPAGERIVIEAEAAPLKGEGAVRLVIGAPRSIQVLRGELEGRPRG